VTKVSAVPPSDVDSPPDYKDALEDDGAPLLERDAVMNDGIEMRDASGDEAIDLGSAYDGDFPSARVGGMQPNWNFSALAQPYPHNYPASATSIELGSVGARSDDVQHNSSASEGSMAGRLADFDAADVDEDYVDQSPVPDLDEDQVDLLSLHGELGEIAARGRYEEVVVPEVPGSEGEAAEIHVHEGEGVN
jgi:ubiquitin carboxyl-terminal hydrolase 4/11/15